MFLIPQVIHKKRKKKKIIDRNNVTIYRNIMILNHVQTNAGKLWWHSLIRGKKGGLP